MPTAILVDGDFFIRRYRYLSGNQPPQSVAHALHRMCLEHLQQADGTRELYRIFFYDCPPLTKKEHYPISGNPVDFSTTPTARWRTELHHQLCSLRKVALRLGYLSEHTGRWVLHPEKLKALLAGTISVRDLTDDDWFYDVIQKGVDMRIGLDIASMAYKKQVDQIILVGGDSDFVPAAKLARREGIDFILDPLWASIRNDLRVHVDGLRTVLPRRDNDSGPPAVPLQATAPNPCP